MSKDKHPESSNSLNVAVLQKAVDDLSKSEQNTEAWQEAMGKVKEVVKAASPASPASTAQRYAYQITINNPQTYGCDHLTIKQTLIDHFPTLRYFCMADEIGENGTYHTHIYVCFNSRVRFRTVQKHFNHAYITPAFGSVQSNLEYIRKSGKWKDTEKAETSVKGTFEDWGTVPSQKGTILELEELYRMVEAGYTNAEILAINHDYIRYIDTIDKVRITLQIEKFKGQRRLDLHVTYVYGATGTGKTRDILDRYGDASVYRVTDYQHPFDSYACQPVMAFEEFRSNLRISDMLNYCDIYPLELPARYTNKYACYTKVYITSNWSLEEQYPEVQKESPETWKAFLRRIHEVQVYDKSGNITVYDSVEKYLHRKETFHPVSPEEECPFGTQEELPFMDGKEVAHEDKR